MFEYRHRPGHPGNHFHAIPMKSPKLQRWIDLLAALLRHHLPVSFEQLIREVPAYGGEPVRRRPPPHVRARQGRAAAASASRSRRSRTRRASRVGYRLAPATSTCRTSPSAPRTSPPPRGRGSLDRYGYASLPTLAFEPRSWTPWPMPPPASASSATHSSPSTWIPLCGSLRATCRWTSARAARHAGLPPRAKVDTPDLLAALGEALERPEAGDLRLSHHGERRSARRTVEPLGLFFLNQHWYLAGRAPGEETVKNFSVSRIAEPEVNGRKPGTPDYEIPADFDCRARPVAPGVGAG